MVNDLSYPITRIGGAKVMLFCITCLFLCNYFCVYA